MSRLYNLLILTYLTIHREEVNDMAVIYATLIVKGKRTYKSVPSKLKNEVKEILISLECEDLIEE